MLTTKYQTNFDAGELSPLFETRVDVDQRASGVKELVNGHVLPQGGVTKRPGTINAGLVRNSARPAINIDFTFDRSKTLQLVLNDGYIQFFDVATKKWVETSPGVRYQHAHPYTDAELAEVRYAQRGASVWLVHYKHPPKRLERLTATHWIFGDVTFIYNAVSDVTFKNAFIRFKIVNSDKPFKVGQYFTVTMTGGSIGAYTPTPAGGTGPDLGNGQLAAVGSESMSGSSPNEVWTITCTFATAKRQEWSVTGSVSSAPGVSNAYKHAAWWCAGNYPSTLCFYQDRLFLACSPVDTQTIWTSAVGDYMNLTLGTEASDAFQGSLDGDVRAIQHLVPSPTQLIALTTIGETSISGPNNGTFSGVAGAMQKTTSTHGANSVRPVQVGYEVLFVDFGGKKTRAVGYSTEVDTNLAPDVTLLASHMTKRTSLIDMGYAESPNNLVWFVRSDGVMPTLTHDRSQKATSWARQVTDGAVESVSTCRNGAVHEVFIIVKRTIAGVEKRFLEYFDYDEEDVIYADCAIWYEGSPTTTIAVPHLIGKTVAVMADGAVHPNRTVDEDGFIELEQPASFVTVGLPFTMTVALITPEFGDASASSASRRWSVTDLAAYFYETTAAKINGKVVPFRTSTIGLQEIVPPQSDWKEVKVVGWNPKKAFTIVSDTPTPMTVLGITMKAAVN